MGLFCFSSCFRHQIAPQPTLDSHYTLWKIWKWSFRSKTWRIDLHLDWYLTLEISSEPRRFFTMVGGKSEKTNPMQLFPKCKWNSHQKLLLFALVDKIKSESCFQTTEGNVSWKQSTKFGNRFKFFDWHLILRHRWKRFFSILKAKPCAKPIFSLLFC